MRFNFIITYRYRTQQIRFDALSRRAYLAPKEGDAAYDQQWSTLLKPEQLQLRTTHITTSMDVAFFQDIRVSLQSDPLALKFKSHSNSSNPGEIQTLDSQIPDSMVIDSESPNQTISNYVSIDHKEVKCPKMILIQDSSFVMGSCVMWDYFMFRKAHVDFECFSLDTIFHRRDILVLTKPWSLFLETFGGHKCGNQSKNLSQRMTSVPVPRFQSINCIDYYGRSRFQKNH